VAAGRDTTARVLGQEGTTVGQTFEFATERQTYRATPIHDVQDEAEALFLVERFAKDNGITLDDGYGGNWAPRLRAAGFAPATSWHGGKSRLGLGDLKAFVAKVEAGWPLRREERPSSGRQSRAKATSKKRPGRTEPVTRAWLEDTWLGQILEDFGVQFKPQMESVVTGITAIRETKADLTYVQELEARIAVLERQARRGVFRRIFGG
jgi:hypothetical protein